jgi:HEAT repeat protein
MSREIGIHMDEESERLLAKKEQQRQMEIERNRRDSEPVLADLAKSGFQVEWVEELYIKRLNYKNAIPVLLKWLPLIDNLDVKEAIVRALTVSWAKPIAEKPLLAEFKKMINDSNIRINWAIANALVIVATDKSYTEIANLLQDPRSGPARKMLTLALGNMKNPLAEDKLIDLLEDDFVAGHAIIALGNLRSTKAYNVVRKFLIHPKSWVREEAKKALAKIENTKSK